MKQWYAVYTKNDCEKKVYNLLSKKNIECFLPFCSTHDHWTDRKKTLKCLFPAYVFVKITQDQCGQVKKTGGVINFIYWLNKPVIIKDVEIDMMKRFLSEHKNIQIEKKSVKIDGMVRLIGSGNLSNGHVTESNYTTQTKLFLPTLGYFLTADSEASNITKIETSSSRKKSISAEISANTIPIYQIAK
jgi:transcription antitermination factor NusG